MTQLLAQAFQQASELPATLQDQLAQELLEEIGGELLWDESLAKSGDALDRMAEQALAEHRAGKTKEMDFDEL